MERTDTSQLNAARAEVTIWRALQTAVREPTDVNVLTASGGSLHVRVAIRQRAPGEARNAIAAVFGSVANSKHVWVVDPDIDVRSDGQMDWAMATRFQADRDLVVQSGFRAVPLDPSLQGSARAPRRASIAPCPSRRRWAADPSFQRRPPMGPSASPPSRRRLRTGRSSSRS